MSSDRGQLFVVSAASGSGKSTLVDRVTARLENTGRVITCTTRAPRGQERDGVDYHFLTRDEFEHRISTGDFLEYARIHGGNLYGTSRTLLEQALSGGRDMFLVVDIQGATAVRAAMPEAVFVFILPPSYRVLEERLRSRAIEDGVADSEDLVERLETARQEVRCVFEYSFVVVNDELERASTVLESLVIAHRSRLAQQRERIDSILGTFGRENAHA
ncbi:MAG: guanylate kinase [Blastocatellia bacterium]|nr:guanylate kinase [Blastocatellia bacterium]